MAFVNGYTLALVCSIVALVIALAVRWWRVPRKSALVFMDEPLPNRETDQIEAEYSRLAANPLPEKWDRASWIRGAMYALAWIVNRRGGETAPSAAADDPAYWAAPPVVPKETQQRAGERRQDVAPPDDVGELGGTDRRRDDSDPRGKV